MNYKEYFQLSREKWREDNRGTFPPRMEDFYSNPARHIPINTFGLDYGKSVASISNKVFDYFTDNKKQGIMLEYPNIWNLTEELNILSDYIVSYLEDNMYGCYLYVDKIYIYRTTKCERDSSYIWHYDNNPNEIVKNIIYLNDVDDNNSPFEYLSKPNGEGYMFNSHRTGPEKWNKAPNGSRVNKEVKELESSGHKAQRVTGPKGTTFAFNNNTCHRANPIIEGYRDVVNIRVKPTLKKIDFINGEYTSSFEKNGVVNPNPELI
tara:strand:+ start:260 stop:1051 length:792 start_codon:yes stop_codon:yes gene_type:complete